ncbi:hypothetical protein TNCV_604111 [Trichonephila clavipes]|nr:hypothetical protein TNCV_604111 [Trichonephila clavipes]
MILCDLVGSLIGHWLGRGSVGGAFLLPGGLSPYNLWTQLQMIDLSWWIVIVPSGICIDRNAFEFPSAFIVLSIAAESERLCLGLSRTHVV